MDEYPMNKYDNHNDYDNYDYDNYDDINYNMTGDNKESDNIMMYLGGFMCFTFIASHCIVHLCGIWDNSHGQRDIRTEETHISNERFIKEQHRRLKIKNETKIKIYNDALLILDSECSICLEKFEEGEKISTLKCNHNFHAKCIGEWLDTNFTCPLCRFSL